VAIRNTPSGENGFPRQSADWLGMTGKTTIYNVKNRMPILLALKE